MCQRNELASLKIKDIQPEKLDNYPHIKIRIRKWKLTKGYRVDGYTFQKDQHMDQSSEA